MARVAIIGGGWAGLAAAVLAVQAGHAVTLFEAARSLGGRARALPLRLPDGRDLVLDNGQHILIGAYTRTLALMQQVGVDPAEVLLRLPLSLRHPDGSGIALPDWPAPWDAAAGIATARGWSTGDKLALLRVAGAWRLRGFRCAEDASVAQLCAGLPARVREELIEPLCVSALNVPADRASGTVFLRVLRDSLFTTGHGGWGGSNLLLPRRDLGTLFPAPAGEWLRQRGAQLRLGVRVAQLAPGWQVDGEPFDRVLLACPPGEAARLVRQCGVPAEDWLRAAEGLAFEGIATVYARAVGEPPLLPTPMLALRGGPAQFVFDRGALGGPAGLLAFVVSASQGEREALQAGVMVQAAALGWRLEPLRTVVEKRATFACTPGLPRPGVRIGPGLAACGDYLAGPYPATLEGAVRSAAEALAALDGAGGAAAPDAKPATPAARTAPPGW